MGKVTAKNIIRRNRILRLLLEEGKLSLTEISKRTGISLPMVSKLINSLKKEKFIRTEEGARTDRAGRPPIIAQLNGDAGYVVGIDLGHRNTNIIIMNLRQKVILEKHIASLSLGSDPALIEWLVKITEEAIDEAVLARKDLFGIGLSIPGIVRGREGRGITYLNFGERTVAQLLQERFNKPVHIEHDAKAMALGERWFGAARSANNVLVLNVGWGLGLGILIDGKIYYGRDGYAGEFGHIQIIRDGELCECGKYGCLETVASGKAIGKRAKEKLALGQNSKLLQICNGDLSRIDAELVAKTALTGDKFSIEILEEAGRYLGEGLAQLINLFNPEKIIIGGRVSQAGQFILDSVRSTAMKLSLIQLGSVVDFTISELGVNAGALGVAMLATRDIFEVEHLNPTAYV